MHKQQLYADKDGLISAGVLAVPRTGSTPKFFFSTLTSGYDFRAEDDSMAHDLHGQMQIALKNIDKALKQAESGPNAIVRLTVFVKDRSDADPTDVTTDVAEVIQAFFSFARPGNMVLPAQSVVFVSRLPYDRLGQLVGIEATAIVD